MNLNQYSIAAAQPGLSVDRILNLYAPVPPAPEQTAITRYLDEAIASITSVTRHANREIELLREYRTRLIAAVVTGKLDVREAAKTLPNADLSSSVDETDIMQAESKAPNVKFGSAGEADL